MIHTKKHILIGSEGREILLDIHIPKENPPLAWAVFHHGFKGFKDWGHWKQIAYRFAETGVAFLKFNFSHNGTTVAQPEHFADLEAFGHNTYSKELYDSTTVIRWLLDESPYTDTVQGSRLFLIGHSRGGPIALLNAIAHDLAGALLWASVHTLDYAWTAPGLLEQWRKDGVYHVLNGRTGVQMPLYYGLYEDFESNMETFDTKEALIQNHIPLCILHGKQDPAIPVQAAKVLHQWANRSELTLLDDCDHVFGGRHPWDQSQMPLASGALCQSSLRWIKKTLSGSLKTWRLDNTWQKV